MSRNDRWLEAKYHIKNCNRIYLPLQRLYERRAIQRKIPKSGVEESGRYHYHGTSQQYVGLFWFCPGCKLILSDPVQCPKCESRDITNGKNDNYDQRNKYDQWHCKTCKHVWKVKIYKMKTNRVEIR